MISAKIEKQPTLEAQPTDADYYSDGRSSERVGGEGMTRNAKSNYGGKCGTCSYFAFYVKNGDTRERGRCCHPNRVNYHQASQKACKLYKAESEGVE